MLFSPSETEQVTTKHRPKQAQNQKRRTEMNPLQELLKKKRAEPTTKRQYFRNNQKTVIELLDAGATHAEILQAFELDGVTMSARYFSRLLNDASPKERPESSSKLSTASVKTEGTKALSPALKQQETPRTGLPTREQLLASKAKKEAEKVAYELKEKEWLEEYKAAMEEITNSGRTFEQRRKDSEELREKMNAKKNTWRRLL